MHQKSLKALSHTPLQLSDFKEEEKFKQCTTGYNPRMLLILFKTRTKMESKGKNSPLCNTLPGVSFKISNMKHGKYEKTAMNK